MSNQTFIEDRINQATAELQNNFPSPLIDAVNNFFLSNKSLLHELTAALKQGDLTQEEFQLEIEREKRILEAQLLTYQIIAKAEVQKLVNKAMAALTQALV